MVVRVIEPDLDQPAWERRGGMRMESVGQVSAAHELVQVPARPRYTTQTPNQTGWFFNRPKGAEKGVPLYVFEDGGYYYVLDPSGRFRRDVRTMVGDEWASHPIEEPD